MTSLVVDAAFAVHGEDVALIGEGGAETALRAIVHTAFATTASPRASAPGLALRLRAADAALLGVGARLRVRGAVRPVRQILPDDDPFGFERTVDLGQPEAAP